MPLSRREESLHQKWRTFRAEPSARRPRCLWSRLYWYVRAVCNRNRWLCQMTQVSQCNACATQSRKRQDKHETWLGRNQRPAEATGRGLRVLYIQIGESQVASGCFFTFLTATYLHTRMFALERAKLLGRNMPTFGLAYTSKAISVPGLRSLHPQCRS